MRYNYFVYFMSKMAPSVQILTKLWEMSLLLLFMWSRLPPFVIRLLDHYPRKVAFEAEMPELQWMNLHPWFFFARVAWWFCMKSIRSNKVFSPHLKFCRPRNHSTVLDALLPARAVQSSGLIYWRYRPAPLPTLCVLTLLGVSTRKTQTGNKNRKEGTL